ncbi:phenylalanine--tRNA ligase subunit alpha [Nafulsella turpanensis]|uniref:phenylalanine--tRNA ligase subunit alpha n=1 Tax=Nafulsella turpanensis TaxID=1265690 RepID=UPI00034BE87B|nr:phenylalanine--tRNA ligase subunit alpha [Nafulsella turpanensis]
MSANINSIKEEIESYLVSNQEELEQYRQRFIGRKNILASLFAEMKNIPAEQRKEYGQQINELKEAATVKFQELIQSLEDEQSVGQEKHPDLTLPPQPDTLGGIHPLSATRSEIIRIFERIGFNVSEGPEIEDDWHNFTALNFPENHPAREMQDTFFIRKKPDIALRTHTSSVQVRVMESERPPIRTLSPGRVYRNEAISARAHCVFHQVEGLFIDEGVSFADLKQTLYYFVKELFGKQTKVRFRPSYFPFTEPSAEMDITCIICGGEGCNICKHTGWVEIGGAGMVDPQVLENSGIDSKKYSGFAFGMGIERITMLKYQIRDLRLFTENDVRFLRQFSSLT